MTCARNASTGEADKEELLKHAGQQAPGQRESLSPELKQMTPEYQYPWLFSGSTHMCIHMQVHLYTYMYVPTETN